jgi:hypothetical protein
MLSTTKLGLNKMKPNTEHTMSLEELLKAQPEAIDRFHKLIEALDEAGAADGLEDLREVLSTMIEKIDEKLEAYEGYDE